MTFNHSFFYFFLLLNKLKNALLGASLLVFPRRFERLAFPLGGGRSIQLSYGNKCDCNVSHSKRRTKRKFDVNLFTKKFYWVEQDCWVSLNVSANGLRIINKMGLDAAIRRASEKGYL